MMLPVISLLIRCMVSISFTSMAWKEVHSCQRSRHLIRISRRIWPTGELYTASKAVGEEQNTALKSAWDTNIGNLSDADGVNSKQSAQDYAKVLSQSEYNAAKENNRCFPC